MKTKYTINQESKSYLANLLATENLEVQYKKTATASFDVKNRVLTIPIWKKDLSEPVTDLFVSHEVGHALYTPMSLLTKAHKLKINHSIVNVVEDARIEKLIKRRYNGLRQSFIRGYRELIAKNFFGTQGKDINEYLLIDRLNIHFKSSHVSSNVKFTDEEMKYVEMMENLETVQDVIKVSKLLQEYCNQEKEETGRDQEINFDDHEFEEVDPEEITDEEKESAEPLNTDGTMKDDQDETSSIKETDTKQDEADPISTGVSGKTDDLDQAISETDRDWESQKQTLTDSECPDNEYAYLHKFDDDKIIVDYKTVIKDFKKFYSSSNSSSYYSTVDETKKAIAASKIEYNKFKKRSLKTVMYLVKEFEQKKSAALYARASSDKTGVLDPLKLHSYKYADDVFKRLTILPDGKNHGLMLLLDWSGSMHDKVLETTEQLVQLTMFCRKINVPYEVYAFTNAMNGGRRYSRYDNDNSDSVNYKLGDTQVDEEYKLIQWSSSTMNNRDFDTNLYNLYTLANTMSNRSYRRNQEYNCYADMSYPQSYSMSSTPLNDSLIHLHTLVPQFQNKYSIDKMNTILLTDGGSDRGCHRYDPTPRQFTPGFRNRNTYIVNKKTRRQYLANSRDFTNALIESLRDQTGTKVVNFYIQSRKAIDMWQHNETHGTKDQYGYRQLSPKTETLIKQQWKKDRVVVAERGKHNTSYDEQYTINSSSLKISDEAMATPSENAKTGELKRLFSKSRNSSLQSRVLLNRFIKLVA